VKKSEVFVKMSPNPKQSKKDAEQILRKKRETHLSKADREKEKEHASEFHLISAVGCLNACRFADLPPNKKFQFGFDFVPRRATVASDGRVELMRLRGVKWR
jgi:hypothetical protein